MLRPKIIQVATFCPVKYQTIFFLPSKIESGKQSCQIWFVLVADFYQRLELDIICLALPQGFQSEETILLHHQYASAVLIDISSVVVNNVQN